MLEQDSINELGCQVCEDYLDVYNLILQMVFILNYILIIIIIKMRNVKL